MSISRVSVALLALSGSFALFGCKTLKPYEKEHLLDPAMADDEPQAIAPGLMSSGAGRFEKLGSGTGQAVGTACPTCGG